MLNTDGLRLCSSDCITNVGPYVNIQDAVEFLCGSTREFIGYKINGAVATEATSTSRPLGVDAAARAWLIDRQLRGRSQDRSVREGESETGKRLC